MAPSPLSPQEIERRLADLEGWELSGHRLVRRFQFLNFIEAFGWMTSVALVAQSMNHHPEWRNVYNTVDVELTTHDAAGITDSDFELAEAMNRLAR